MIGNIPIFGWTYSGIWSDILWFSPDRPIVSDNTSGTEHGSLKRTRVKDYVHLARFNSSLNEYEGFVNIKDTVDL